MYGIPSHIERFIRNLKRTNPSASITLFSDRDKQSFSGDTFEYIDEYIQRDPGLQATGKYRGVGVEMGEPDGGIRDEEKRWHHQE